MVKVEDLPLVNIFEQDENIRKISLSFCIRMYFYRGKYENLYISSKKL